uniref:Serine/threonine-protein kinase haspin n=1 Tax=Anas platyrhynchos TaxID=8839 RepID=A0A8B9TS86_ANAPL
MGHGTTSSPRLPSTVGHFEPVPAPPRSRPPQSREAPFETAAGGRARRLPSGRPGPAMPLQPRLLRTYSRRGGHLRPLPQPSRWISPPQDRRRLFSSTSAGSSSACSSALSAASDDPDFSPPGKRRRQPLGERPARARCLRSRTPQWAPRRSRRTPPAELRLEGGGSGLQGSLELFSMKADKKAGAQPSCQKPASPLGPQGMVEYKNKCTKVSSAEGSACRRACISGFSAKRWDRQMRLCPQRLKNKRQQQANNSSFRPQLRPKGRKKGGREISVDTRDNDCSFLNNSYAWGRLRASLYFHKKKKVTADECSYNSILCTPSVNSEVTGHQATPNSSMAQYCALSASSMILLVPRNACSGLEVMLTDAEKVLGECQQERPITFEECIPLDKMKDCKKIGEGVFGEVFQIDSNRGPVALKIIPIEGTERVNGEAQKSFGEILPEIIISKELSLLSEESVNRTVGFVSLYSVHCVQGAYPKYLLEAWDKYDKVTGSENDRPDLFGKEQLFMVLEFEFGGSDLENMRKRLNSVASAKSILHQVTASLAVAEQELHFEHRDLHWGNVLVKKTDVKELNYVLNGTTCTIPTRGIHVNIIDYTLSRLEKDGLTVFCDLSTDEELFQGTGDYQFDIYRQMKAENSNSWTDYHPHSNVLWLHYLSDKLLKDVVYKKKESNSVLRKIKQQLIKFRKEVLTFGSASEVLHSSSLFQ